MNSRNKNLIISVALMMVMVAIIGTTYAYFSAIITGNESTSTIVLTGGKMEIAYDNLSDEIEVFDIYPKEEAWVSKNFTVTGTNTTDKVMRYKLGLKVDYNTFSSDALTYTLTSTNTSNKGTVVSSITNEPINISVVNFGIGSFPQGENMVHTYKFELFFKDTGEDQNKDQEKGFAAHITIKEAPFNEIALSSSNLSSIGYTNGEVPASLVIPERYQVGEDYNQVTSIADYPFHTGTLANKDVVPIESLSNLTSLTLNEGLEKIGDAAFYQATNLTGTITMPSTVKSIGKSAFRETGITGLALNEGLERIANSAFYKATNLTGTITIPSTLKNVGVAAFRQTSITELVLNDGLEIIGDSAFAETANLTGTITIPSTVKSIEDNAFINTGITGLILNEGLEYIGGFAFGALTSSNLTGTLTIPSTVKSIDDGAFFGTKITSLVLKEGLETIKSNAFYKTKNLTETLTIPSTVKSIGDYAFQNTGITGLVLNEGLEIIKIAAFNNATNLTGVLEIPSTVNTIKRHAFTASAITGLVLKEGLETIGERAFARIANLIGTVTIPSTVKSIGDYAFTQTGITTINYPGTEEEWNKIEIGTDAFPSGVIINYNVG